LAWEDGHRNEAVGGLAIVTAVVAIVLIVVVENAVLHTALAQGAVAARLIDVIVESAFVVVVVVTTAKAVDAMIVVVDAATATLPVRQQRVVGIAAHTLPTWLMIAN
jgi:hypothetical protein